MSLSIKIFRIKKFFAKLLFNLKLPFVLISEKFHNINNKDSTKKTVNKISETGERVIYNFKENKENWKNRTFREHGFKIEEEDS